MINKNGIPIGRRLQTNRPKLGKNIITTFAIKSENGEYDVYKILGTRHSFERLEEYNLDRYHIAGSLLSLGDKLTQYNNSGKHILLPDEDRGLSVVFTVENYTVVLVTVIDRGDSLPSLTKKHTIIERIG